MVEGSCDGLTVYSVQLSDEEYNRMLDALTDTLVGRHPIVIGDDFNAWAVEWISRLIHARGTAYWKPWQSWI